MPPRNPQNSTLERVAVVETQIFDIRDDIKGINDRMGQVLEAIRDLKEDRAERRGSERIGRVVMDLGKVVVGGAIGAVTSHWFRQ